MSIIIYLYSHQSLFIDYLLVIPTMLFGTRGVPFLILYILLFYKQQYTILYILGMYYYFRL